VKKFIDWLENSFSPRMSKINNNVWIVTLKDSIMQTLPFIFLGSLFAMLAILNDYVPWLPSFWTPFGWTMGMISLFISFLIPFNLMEKKRLRKQRLIAGMASVVLFLITITPQVVADGDPGFGHSALGAGGMFVAIVSGLFTGWVMSLFGKFSFFKEDSVIPDFVRAWFDAMLPVGIIVVAGWLVVDLLQFDQPAVQHRLLDRHRRRFGEELEASEVSGIERPEPVALDIERGDRAAIEADRHDHLRQCLAPADDVARIAPYIGHQQARAGADGVADQTFGAAQHAVVGHRTLEVTAPRHDRDLSRHRSPRVGQHLVQGEDSGGVEGDHAGDHVEQAVEHLAEIERPAAAAPDLEQQGAALLGGELPPPAARTAASRWPIRLCHLALPP